MHSYSLDSPVDRLLKNKYFYLMYFVVLFYLWWSHFNFELNCVTILKCLIFAILAFTIGGIFFYLILLIPYFWENQRQFIYTFLNNNEIIIWILDSFMSPIKIFLEFWSLTSYFDMKVLICRITVYFLAIICYKVTVLLMVLFFISLYISALHHFLKYFSYPYRTSFPFKTLPYSIQHRFFELQPPSIRYRFTKVYPKRSMISYFNNLYVDNLCLTPENYPYDSILYETSEPLNSSPYQNFKNIANGFSNIQLNVSHKDWNKIKSNTNLSVLNCLELNEFLYDEICQFFSKVDLSNLRNLEIYHTKMDFQELMILKSLNLKYVCLLLKNDGKTYLEKAMEILEATVNIPKLEFFYEYGILKKEDNFEVFLVEWVISNGYFKSFVCYADYEEQGKEIELVKFKCENFSKKIFFSF